MAKRIRLRLVRRYVVCSGLARHRAFPSVEKLQNGDVLVAFREGTDHWQTPDSVVRTVRSTDGGNTWSPPVTVTSDLVWARGCHLGLTQLADGTLLLPFTEIYWLRPPRRQVGYLMRSYDQGHTWEPPRELEHIDGMVWQTTYGKILEREDGTLWISVGGQRREEKCWRTGLLVSEDGGQTCTRFVTVASGLADEKSVLVLPDGRWIALIRDIPPIYIAPTPTTAGRPGPYPS